MINLDFSKIKVLIIGDLMIDHYIICNSNRQSPEAPVPVLTKVKEYFKLGGAANVASNMRSLGAEVTCLGYVGADSCGKKLISLMESQKINSKYVEINDKIITTVKKRYYQQKTPILRFDNEKKINNWIPSAIQNISFNKFDLIVLSDYDKGVLNNNWYNNINHQNIIVDPKKENFDFYKGANVITPNHLELEKAYGAEIRSSEETIKACNQLISKYSFKYIIAKRGAKGIIVVGENFSQNIKALKVEDVDVTGAGDTVISYFSLAYTLTKDVILSAKIANYAASKAVSHFGTTVLSSEEIAKIKLELNF